MNDYTKDIYKAVSCKTATKGTTMFIDDFGDIWTMIPQVNRFGENSTYRQYTGNLCVAPQPLSSGLHGNFLYLGELVPTYHFSVQNPAPFIQGLTQQIQYYLQNRLGKIQARYNKKPLRCRNAGA